MKYITICLIISSFWNLDAAQMGTQEQRLDTFWVDLLTFDTKDKSFDAVKKYTEAGRSLLGVTETGETALMIAIKQQSPRIAKLIIEAIEKKHGKDFLKKYINAHTEYTDDERSGHTALSLAAELGDLQTATLLLKKGAQDSLEIATAAGYTPLLFAAGYNRLDIAKLLLTHKAKINAQNNDGQTPLILAASQHNLPIVALLLEKGAGYTHKDKEGKTALDHTNKNTPVWKLLKNYAEKMQKSQQELPKIREELAEHLIPPLASITAEYTMPHAQEERKIIEEEQKKIAASKR